MNAPRIAIIIGSTRPGRNGESVAKWVYEIAQKRTDAEFELVDIKDFNLPLLDEPVPPIMGQYSKPHTKAWAAKVGSFDGYVFVTPEYNHGVPGALKNAIDFLPLQTFPWDFSLARIEAESSTVEIDVGDEPLFVPVAVGFLGQALNLVVQPFQRAVGQPSLAIG